jgi:hypothetical protein
MEMLVMKVLKHLSTGINWSGSTFSPTDEIRAKTYLKLLYCKTKYISPDEVYMYLKNDLNWNDSLADKLRRMVIFKNDGKFHRGIDKNLTLKYLKIWVNEMVN